MGLRPGGPITGLFTAYSSHSAAHQQSYKILCQNKSDLNIFKYHCLLLHLVMDKVTILKELESTGVVSTFKRHPTWEKAFNLYKEKTGNNKKMSCGSCFREVLRWLRS